MEQEKYEDDAGELEITEDYIVLDDATTGSGSQLDLSSLRKRKTKMISSAKETIENGESYCQAHLGGAIAFRSFCRIVSRRN